MIFAILRDASGLVRAVLILRRDIAMPTPGHLHEPEYLNGLAHQLREEADRAEARAKRLVAGDESASCAPGCWNILSTCIQVQPL